MPSRNVLLLSLCQALGQAAAPSVLLVGGIVGAGLAPSCGLSTLPVTATVVGTALFTLPAALIMKRLGRRFGFVGATVQLTTTYQPSERFKARGSMTCASSVSRLWSPWPRDGSSSRLAGRP